LDFVVFSRRRLWLWRAVGVLVLWCFGGAGSPGALLSPGVLGGEVFGNERCGSVWRYFFDNGIG
jgi:hypothetical protein